MTITWNAKAKSQRKSGATVILAASVSVSVSLFAVVAGARSGAATPTPSATTGINGFGNYMGTNTTESTCTYKRVDNGTNCVLSARTCFECLNVEPSSGEKCVLTASGLCMNMSAYNQSQDFQRTGPSFAWQEHLNNFPSNETKYCGLDDNACSICRANVFAGTWQTTPSQYCPGADNCVCVSICEVEAWEASIQPGLIKVINETEGSNASKCSLKPITTFNASSGSADVDMRADAIVSKSVMANTDLCMWYQSQTYCGQPRSCGDCLNYALMNGDHCVLHASGYCASMNTYSYARDFRRVHLNTTAVLFPSTNTTYCGSDDAACNECRATKFKNWTSASPSPVYCTGQNGCVCLAACESPGWKQSINDMGCAMPPPISDSEDGWQKLGMPATFAMSVLAFAGVVTYAWLVVQRVRLRRQQRAIEAAMERWRHRSPKGPRLALNGWNAMRQELIDSERAVIDADVGEAEAEISPASTSSPPNSAANHTRLTIMAPSVILEEEENDGYRPLSPSRQHR